MIVMYAALAELFPCPELPVVALLSLAAGFWYGYRHPKGS